MLAQRVIALAAVVVAASAAATAAAGAAAPAPPPEFSADETRRILRHGPWPQPVLPDPSNRVSGNPYAISLGRALFFDTRLSGRGDMACATCHQPGKGFADGRERAQGSGVAKKRLDRNTPSLWSAGLAHWFGWDGASDSLWAFSIRPILNPDELAATPRQVAALIRRDPTLACQYRNAFGVATQGGAMHGNSKRGARTQRGTGSHQGNGAAKGHARGATDELHLVNIAKALAAYVETLNAGQSEFDQLHEALSRGDTGAAAHYPAAARRGLALFTGRGQCSVCHFGPNFSNGEFHDIGIPYLAAPGRVDPGRHGGISIVRQDKFNRLGAFSDDASRASGSRTRHVMQNHSSYGQFKVPSLRNVELTAPYMHNGSLATLRDAVRHYSELSEDRLHQDGEALLKPLRMSESEIDDMVAFLNTLTSRDYPAAPATPENCRSGAWR